MLSDSPPERDLEWTESGVEGAHRFIQKIWKLTQQAKNCPSDVTLSPDRVVRAEEEMLARALHKAIEDISTDIERFAFNRCVAHLHILVNALGDYRASDTADEDIFAHAMQQFSVLLSPFSPHIAEEIWRLQAVRVWCADTSWPVADSHWLKSDTIEVAIQVNGKVRARIDLPADCPAKEAEEKALALESLQRYLEGKPLSG